MVPRSSEAVAETSAAAAPAAAPPPGLRVAAGAVALEAVGLAVAGVFAAVSTADGRSYQMGSGVALTLIAFGTAAGLVPFVLGLLRVRPWTRTPVAVAQTIVVLGAIMLLQGHRPEWAVPALVLVVACAAGLFSPASLKALNRPPMADPKPRREPGQAAAEQDAGPEAAKPARPPAPKPRAASQKPAPQPQPAKQQKPAQPSQSRLTGKQQRRLNKKNHR